LNARFLLIQCPISNQPNKLNPSNLTNCFHAARKILTSFQARLPILLNSTALTQCFMRTVKEATTLWGPSLYLNCCLDVKFFSHISHIKLIKSCVHYSDDIPLLSFFAVQIYIYSLSTNHFHKESKVLRVSLISFCFVAKRLVSSLQSSSKVIKCM